MQELVESDEVLHELETVAALLFTATVTPVEVAFLDEGTRITTLWVINRVVDLAFMIDMFITFNLAFPIGGLVMTALAATMLHCWQQQEHL